MSHGAGTAGLRYLEQLNERDLSILARAAGLVVPEPHDAASHFRSNPGEIEKALSTPQTFSTLFPDRSAPIDPPPTSGLITPGDPGFDDAAAHASPYLVFAVAVHRGLVDLEDAVFVEERVGPHRRLPIFDTDSLRTHYEHSERRLFAIEHLASYTRVRSGPVWVRRGNKLRRHKYSELDAQQLAATLAVVTDAERPGIYRRLGDLALFQTGVFPDHTARTTAHPILVSRLVRSLEGHRSASPTAAEIDSVINTDGMAGLLGFLGPRWYQLAAQLSPIPAVERVLTDAADGFDHARRFLTFLTTKYLFPDRGRLFGTSA